MMVRAPTLFARVEFFQVFLLALFSHGRLPLLRPQSLLPVPKQADRLLELGFQEEVAELVKSCPVGRQTLLFSATMNTKVDDLASLALNKVGARVRLYAGLAQARWSLGAAVRV